jgi:hypothetical protein
MPKQKQGVNKSEEVRQLLRANPKMPAKEIVQAQDWPMRSSCVRRTGDYAAGTARGR